MAGSMQPSGSSFVEVSGLDFLNTPEFAAQVAKFQGREINMDLVRELGAAMLAYAQKHDRPTLSIELPKQDVSTGTLRIGAKTGTYTQLTVRGNRWFTREQIERTLGIRPGEEILVSKLDEAVNWTNSNPFRRVRVALAPDAADASRTEAVVTVEERIPFRTTFSYDNCGTQILGENQFDASATYGNLWNRDHQLTYDFRTSDKPQVYQAHSALYRMPLPWHDTIQVQVAYAQVHAFFNEGHFKTDGMNYVARVNYCKSVKVPWGTVDLNGGLDYKQANSDILFRSVLENDLTNVSNRTYDVAQLSAGGSTIIRDRQGAWLLGASVNLSPGGLNSRNNDTTYGALHTGASSRYAYGSLDLQRMFTLPLGMEFVSQAHTQMSSSNLMGSEQLTIGGQGSARGYDERMFAGDEGITFTNELHSPAWNRVQRLSSKKAVLVRTQGIAFLEFAKARYHKTEPGDAKLSGLASTGLGLRMNVANLFNLAADYGWILHGIRTTQNQLVPDGKGNLVATQVTSSLRNGGRFTIKASLGF